MFQWYRNRRKSNGGFSSLLKSRFAESLWPAAAKAGLFTKELSQQLKRCATQNRVHNRVFPQILSLGVDYGSNHRQGLLSLNPNPRT